MTLAILSTDCPRQLVIQLRILRQIKASEFQRQQAREVLETDALQPLVVNDVHVETSPHVLPTLLVCIYRILSLHCC